MACVMKIQWNKTYTTVAVYALLVICGGILFYLAVSRMEITVSFVNKVLKLITPFIYGFCIAYLLNPLCRWLETRVFAFLEKKKARPRLRAALSILVTYLIAFAVLTGTVMVILPQVAANLKTISVNITVYYDNAVKAVRELMLNVGLSEAMTNQQMSSLLSYLESLTNKSSELIAKALPYVYGFTKSFTTTLLNFVVGIIISIYVLAARSRIFAKSKKLMFALFPQVFAQKTIEVARSSNRIFTGFITGNIIDSLLVGVICYIGMLVFRMPFALLVAILVGITNLIPYFGPFIGTVPSAILILLNDPMKGLGFVVFMLVLQQIDGNIIAPKILGQSTGLSPIWVIFAVIIGGGLFGIPGMFIGVPVFSVIYSLAKELLNARLRKKGLSEKTESYDTPMQG